MTQPAPTQILRELGLPAELVTGEAVVLELRPASFATRALALMLDIVVQVAVYLTLLTTLNAGFGSLDDAAVAAATLAVTVAVLLGLPVTVETLSRGRSLGKLAAGLRVVRDDGGPIRFRQALVRGLVGIFEIYLTVGAVALIVSLTNVRGRRVGDFLAGTYVIRERAGGVTVPPVVMPPMLAGWAREADIGHLPDALALAVRQFLARAAALHPASRARLGVLLAAEVGRHVAPPAPAGVHPEQFMAAVLAERRERDLARLRADRAAQVERERRRAAAPPLSAGSTGLVGEADQ
ncbi:MAG TPA: RDD family protein [Kineosporiaceae bacterium]